jgi:hypothetical protein
MIVHLGEPFFVHFMVFLSIMYPFIIVVKFYGHFCTSSWFDFGVYVKVNSLPSFKKGWMCV